jgi:hypothetical protein
MQASSFPTWQMRGHYRHELRTLTYVTLDEANGGIVRNLNPDGAGVQAVAALRPHQHVRVRFELKHPRLRVDSRGEVTWSNSSGQCGIRFVDLPARTRQQINEWIFGNLLDFTSHGDARSGPVLETFPVQSENHDGLIVSASPRSVIQLKPTVARHAAEPLPVLLRDEAFDENFARSTQAQVDWLSRPVSGRTFAWFVDSLVMVAALLLFALISLSITHELPRWPLALGAGGGATIFVASAYRIICTMFGGSTLGVRLARAAGSVLEDEENTEGEVRLR